MKLFMLGINVPTVSALLVVGSFGIANAADMAVKAPPPTMAPAPSWTGFYLGLDVGGAWGHDNVSPTVADGGTFPRSNHLSLDGAVGGGTLGYNYQFGNFVVGVEGDVGAMEVAKSLADPLGGTEIDFLRNGVYGDATGRLGFLAFSNLLVYGKGGWAAYGGKADTTTALTGFTVGNSGTFTGWTAGGGVEYKLDSHWSAKAEYMYYDFGSETATLTSAAGVFGYTNTLRLNTVKFGLNYLF